MAWARVVAAFLSGGEGYRSRFGLVFVDHVSHSSVAAAAVPQEVELDVRAAMPPPLRLGGVGSVSLSRVEARIGRSAERLVEFDPRAVGGERRTTTWLTSPR